MVVDISSLYTLVWEFDTQTPSGLNNSFEVAYTRALGMVNYLYL